MPILGFFLEAVYGIDFRTISLTRLGKGQADVYDLP